MSDEGCFTLGDRVLLAPFGSSTRGERSVKLAGLGTFEIGELVAARGGVISSPGPEAPAWQAVCAPAKGDLVLADVVS